MKLDLVKMRLAAARAASDTEGRDWAYNRKARQVYFRPRSGAVQFLYLTGSATDQHRAHGAYDPIVRFAVDCQPKAVLALLDRVEELEKRVAALTSQGP